MPSPKPLTDEAVEAGAKVYRESVCLSTEALMRKIIEAAAPYIARAERERIARFLTSDSTCDSILTELAARAGGEIHLARGHAALARWDLKAELKAALTALEPEGSNE